MEIVYTVYRSIRGMASNKEQSRGSRNAGVDEVTHAQRVLCHVCLLHGGDTYEFSARVVPIGSGSGTGFFFFLLSPNYAYVYRGG